MTGGFLVDRANPKEVSPHGRCDIEGLSAPAAREKERDKARYLQKR